MWGVHRRTQGSTSALPKTNTAPSWAKDPDSRYQVRALTVILSMMKQTSTLCAVLAAASHAIVGRPAHRTLLKAIRWPPLCPRGENKALLWTHLCLFNSLSPDLHKDLQKFKHNGGLAYGLISYLWWTFLILFLKQCFTNPAFFLETRYKSSFPNLSLSWVTRGNSGVFRGRADRRGWSWFASPAVCLKAIGRGQRVMGVVGLSLFHSSVLASGSPPSACSPHPAWLMLWFLSLMLLFSCFVRLVRACKGEKAEGFERNDGICT